MHSIRQGDRLDRDFLRDLLLEWGFERTDYVYEPGQFAVRGSLLDVFSFSRELPVRIDFFDDEIESIRLFEVESQLSVGTLPEVVLMPDVAGVFARFIPEEYDHRIAGQTVFGGSSANGICRCSALR